MNRRMALSLVFAFVSVLASGCASGPLRPFETDGCSEFPDGTLKEKELWRSCCIVHDKAYWLGGTYDQRLAADKELKSCVAGVGKPAVAKVMLAGVRVGGSPYWPTRFRWGYGWPWPRGYGELTAEERAQVCQITKDCPW